jgi:uncharacterized protein YjgD (DUF1641 family)
MNTTEITTKTFTLEEVEDIIKSRKNIVYLFKLSGLLKRLLSAAEPNVNAKIFEGCAER